MRRRLGLGLGLGLGLAVYPSRARSSDLLACKRLEPFLMKFALLGNVGRYDIGAFVEYSDQFFTRR